MLPLEVAVLDWAIDHRERSFTEKDILEGMMPLYGSESQCNTEKIRGCCDDLSAIGFFVRDNIGTAGNTETVTAYRITEKGIQRGNRFIPARKR